MGNFKPENMTQEQLEKAMPVWKSYKNLQPIMERENKGICAILEWITCLVECKIKIDTLKSIEQKFPDFQKQVKLHLEVISQLKSSIIQLEGRSRMSGGSFIDESQRIKSARDSVGSEYKDAHKIKEEVKVNDTTGLSFNAKSLKNSPSTKSMKQLSLRYIQNPPAIIEQNNESIGDTSNLFDHSHQHSKNINFQVKTGEDENLNETSLILDLKVTAHENPLESLKEAFKPKPRRLYFEEENKGVKPQMIILNNLTSFPEDPGSKPLESARKSFVDNPFYNLHQDMRDHLKVSFASQDDPNFKNRSIYRKWQKIEDEQQPPVEVRSDNGAFCGKISTSLFCK